MTHKTLKKLRVLYVDDDPINIRLLVRVMKESTAGYTVTTKDSTKEAIQFVKECVTNGFAGAWFIVTDKDAPQKDAGLELTRTLRTLLGEKVYIALLTGDSNFQRTDDDDGLDSGAIRNLDTMANLPKQFNEFLKTI